MDYQRYTMRAANFTFLFFTLLIIVLVARGDPDIENVDIHQRSRRATPQSVNDRPSCKPGAPVPPSRVDTTARLSALRGRFSGIHAYIVPSEDAHQSEYPAAHDLRRQYISGFSGSAGTAVILGNKAALWTDGRYFLEAESQLDCNWILMKSGVTGVPSVTEWLTSELKNTLNARVGASPFFMSNSKWKTTSDQLSEGGVTLVEKNPDLVDDIWTSGRPPAPSSPINALPINYAGKSWQDKITELRADMTSKGAYAFVVTNLDETAWLFNLRASDIEFNPFFISYAIVEHNKTRLYLLNHAAKLIQEPTDSKTTVKLFGHLNTNMNGACTGKVGQCVEVKEYSSDNIINDIMALTANKIWISLLCNQAIFNSIPQAQRIQAKSTVALAKSKKNPIERQGMKKAYNRDSAALIKFLQLLEKEVKEGKHWTEVTAAAKLKSYRLSVEDNRGLSFSSISAVGSNGAIIHYTPSNLTDKQITTREIYLLDSGGQYLDGTTDVTRTFHYGTPTAYEKECYTLVLMGHIDLALLKWPKGLYGRQIDAVARAPLWKNGLRYLHGTGHGIGMYLSVHEGPGRISLSHALNPSDEPLDDGMYFSDEPGYYEDGKFGIRLETVVMVKKVDTKYQFPSTTFLGFDIVTLVPYEPNLINYDMLSDRQIQWLNDYHKRTEDEIGPLLAGTPAYDWMKSKTKPYVRPTSGCSLLSQSTLTVLLIAAVGNMASMFS
ncbi:xaa-Pro aminopeptidase 1-like [Gigantopelta aegis]|uniref:xaa-Pro aminopeptidase 1-like n=1 Tax=Gigantopelta aegis TaxID=1735272 RepID=UPI001B888ADE|nr:xaa-Pro aminopeptidase 1-like [Gigantopelta aegis]